MRNAKFEVIKERQKKIVGKEIEHKLKEHWKMIQKKNEIIARPGEMWMRMKVNCRQLGQ